MKTQHDTNESLTLYDNYKIGLKAKDTDKKFYFIFSDRDLLLIDNQLPLLKDLNELDINATTTYETQYCPVCDMETTTLVYRVPEYTIAIQ